jgi:hypothetical protein
MKMTIAAAFAAIIATAAPARGEYSAREMQSFCRKVVNSQEDADGKVPLPSTFEAGVCWGAITGIKTLWKARFADVNLSERLHLCVPENVSVAQIARVFDQYATLHPENLHEDYWVVMADSLLYAFPCPKPAAGIAGNWWEKDR